MKIYYIYIGRMLRVSEFQKLQKLLKVKDVNNISPRLTFELICEKAFGKKFETLCPKSVKDFNRL